MTRVTDLEMVSMLILLSDLYMHQFVLITVTSNLTICNIQNSFKDNNQDGETYRWEFWILSRKLRECVLAWITIYFLLQIYTYYRSLPMPITSHKFGSIDPISGKDTDDDNGQFVSSVCWRGKSDMLIAANSSGCVKVLQMV